MAELCTLCGGNLYSSIGGNLYTLFYCSHQHLEYFGWNLSLFFIKKPSSLILYHPGGFTQNYLHSPIDTKNQPTSINICSRGSLNSCIVHPREVFKPAILSNASSIILGHNHPSGVTTPSQEDINLTKRLQEAGTILGIEVIDHIIIGDEGYCSFKEKQIL